MDIQSLETALLSKVPEFAPITSLKSIAVLPVAEELRIPVFLNVIPMEHSSGRRIYGELVIGREPRILVHRPGRYRIRRKICSSEEYRLSPQERFTVAHELGHWLAYIDCGVIPVASQGDTKGLYWKYEQIMDRFAQNLLIPDWRLHGLLSTTTHAGVTVFDIDRWCRDLTVTRETLTAKMARCKEDVGFLKLSLVLQEQRRIAKVLFAAAGSALRLPRRSTLIHNQRVVQTLLEKRSGERTFIGLSLDGKTQQDLVMRWLDSSYRSSGPVPTQSLMWWTSWDAARLPDDKFSDLWLGP